MAPPPLPYSRSSVIIRTIANPCTVPRSEETLTDRHFSAGARLVLSQQERQHEHDQSAYSENPVCIDVRERRRLRDQDTIQAAVRLVRRARRIQTSNRQTRGQPGRRSRKRRLT